MAYETKITPRPQAKLGFGKRRNILRGIVSLVVKRSSLAAQVADAIRSEISNGMWSEWIPSQRELSQALHVSRNTCRSALAMLQREKLLEATTRQGARINRTIVRRAHLPPPDDRSLGILVPDVINHLRPITSLMIDALKSELFDLKVAIHVHNSPAIYHTHSRSAFEKFIDKKQYTCWLLINAPESLQRWFMKERLPCVIVGSLYPAIRLPSLDLDCRAICRHAAGKLIALGHRRLVFLNRSTRLAGDRESDAGFLEGIRSSSHQDIEMRIVYHNDSRETIFRLLQELFRKPHYPTGLLVANSYSYLSVATALTQLGFQIPKDVSLISRDDDPFLAHVYPEPARYLYDDPSGSARKCMSLLRPLLETGAVRLDPIRMLPRFSSGASCRAI